MKEVLKGAAMRMPGVVQWLDRLHRLLKEQKNGFEHSALALFREHLGLLPDKDKIFNDFLPGLGQEIAAENALRQILKGLGHRRLTALLEPGHSTDQVSHRSANSAIAQFTAHGAPAYH